MMRTLTGIVRVPPTRSTVRFCSARSSFTCIDSGTSSMSSRNSVPPCASSKRPGLSLIAPVNAPRSWPKSSVSISVSENSAQLTGDERLMPRARSMVNAALAIDFLAGAALAGDDARCCRCGSTTLTKSKIARIRGLWPTTTWSIGKLVGAS